MKKWYQSALCKGILLLAAHVSLAVFMICALIGVSYPGQNYGELLTGKMKRDYKNSQGFANQLREDAVDILSMVHMGELLGKDGKISRDTVIDIPFYDKESSISETPGEFSFQMKDILEQNGSEQIIVCRRANVKEGEILYQYYTPDQFVDAYRKNGWKFKREEDGFIGKDKAEELLREIREDQKFRVTALADKEENMLYEEMWSASQAICIDVKMPGGKTVLELVNTSYEWNGKLTEMSEQFQNVKSSISDSYENYIGLSSRYGEGDTNLSYIFVDYDNGQIRTNRAEYANMEQVGDSISKLLSSGAYLKLASTLQECDTNIKGGNINLSELQHLITGRTEGSTKNIFIVSVDTKYPIKDAYYNNAEAYQKYMPWLNPALKGGFISLIILLVSMVWLTAVSGHSNREEGIVLLFYDKWKTEIGLVLIGSALLGALVLVIAWADEIFSWRWNTLYDHVGEMVDEMSGIMLLTAGASIAAAALFLIGYLSLVRRIKAKTLWKNSISRHLVHMLKYIYQNRSSMTKVLIAGGVMLVIHLCMPSGLAFFVILGVAADIFAIILLAKFAIENEKIKTGIMRISEGDSEYKIPFDGLTGDHLDMAAYVNNIGEGIQNAVEKSMKDERLKTDLITNVSHDIKTPLTSIINYVGLLKQEEFEDPKIQKYLDVLDEKSQRLKTLTEDVVEASKISSGNINLELGSLNVVEMIHQTTGEFAEKFEKRQLQAVVNVPEEPVFVRADGRRMWRIIENIYNNTAKYAMPGTRVYVDLSADAYQVVFSLKNISENPLNINADELTERFIRGDISRSTEGSGLGLSIAQNLTEMQGGDFKVYVDGDLFKVTITFPREK